MPESPMNWSKADLDKLVGEAENLRLEFKSSRLFDESREKIVDKLSKEVSAFANTEGGTLIIGIEEKTVGKSRIAERIDQGIAETQWSPESLQRLIEGNIKPYLAGLRVKAIPLHESRSAYVFVIVVPQGTTAYQASDWRYYGRSEYEVKPLPDQEVRLRMFRGKNPAAVVRVINITRNVIQKPVPKDKALDDLGRFALLEVDKGTLDEITADDALVERAAAREAMARMPPPEYLVRYSFGITLENIGEVNISEFKVRTEIWPSDVANPATQVRSFKDGWPDRMRGIPYLSSEQGTPLQRVNVYPRDVFDIGAYQVTIPMAPHADYKVKLDWTLYLSNSLPLQDQIDLSSEFLSLGEIKLPAE